jgi:hypothetical protein
MVLTVLEEYSIKSCINFIKEPFFENVRRQFYIPFYKWSNQLIIPTRVAIPPHLKMETTNSRTS